jgi:hypothetical protein
MTDIARIVMSKICGWPPLLDWVWAHGGAEALSAEDLQAALRTALTFDSLRFAQWLRARGAPWPPSLADVCGSSDWREPTALWALRQGCPFGNNWTSATCARMSRGRRSLLHQLHELGAPSTCPRR